MREDIDIEAAVAAGILGEDQALALRNHEARRSGVSAASAERIEIASGVADLMSAVGLIALMAALMYLVARFPLGAVLLFPALYWAGGRMTIERKMTASALVLFFTYCVVLSGSAILAAMLVSTGHATMTPAVLDTMPAIVIVPAIVTIGCWAWWRMARLPVAVAAAWISALNFATQCLRAVVPDIPTASIAWIHLSWGAALLVAALWWDISDIRRETIRSRVAFWLHGAAGFFLARGAMVILSGRDDAVQGWHALYAAPPGMLTAASAGVYLALFAVGVLFALLIDRRSLIFATLYYTVGATALLLGNFVIALGVVGGALVAFALNWQRARTALLQLVPRAVAAQLPRTDLIQEGRRPTRWHEEPVRRRWQTLRSPLRD